MSSSKEDASREKFRNSKIILSTGASGPSETSLSDLESSFKRPVWSEKVQGELMDRVKAKAAALAKSIRDKAQADAVKIREEARRQGYTEGMTSAHGELEKAVHEMANVLGRAMDAVGRGCHDIWAGYRQDIITLLRIAVEKIVNVELDQRKRDILTGLIDQAVERLEAHKRFILVIHPSDEDIVEDFQDVIRQKYPGVKQWRVKKDPGMQPGGVIVETEQGLVDSSIASRKAMIEQVIGNLILEHYAESAAADLNQSLEQTAAIQEQVIQEQQAAREQRRPPEPSAQPQSDAAAQAVPADAEPDGQQMPEPEMQQPSQQEVQPPPHQDAEPQQMQPEQAPHAETVPSEQIETPEPEPAPEPQAMEPEPAEEHQETPEEPQAVAQEQPPEPEQEMPVVAEAEESDIDPEALVDEVSEQLQAEQRTGSGLEMEAPSFGTGGSAEEASAQAEEWDEVQAAPSFEEVGEALTDDEFQKVEDIAPGLTEEEKAAIL